MREPNPGCSLPNPGREPGVAKSWLLSAQQMRLPPAVTSQPLFREREKFITRQTPIGETDAYDSENSWISDGLPNSSRRRKRNNGREEGGDWKEK